jgi:hypothetical protein
MPTPPLYAARPPHAQGVSGDTKPQIDVRRARPSQRVGASLPVMTPVRIIPALSGPDLDWGLLHDLEALAESGGLAAICRGLQTVDRNVGVGAEIRRSLRKVLEATPASLASLKPQRAGVSRDGARR